MSMGLRKWYYRNANVHRLHLGWTCFIERPVARVPPQEFVLNKVVGGGKLGKRRTWSLKFSVSFLGFHVSKRTKLALVGVKRPQRIPGSKSTRYHIDLESKQGFQCDQFPARPWIILPTGSESISFDYFPVELQRDDSIDVDPLGL